MILKMKGESGERGLTIIELAVVVVIIAVAALFITPAIGEWIDNYRIKQAARDIVSALQTAKMRAISTHREYRVVFDLNHETYQLQRGNKASGSDSWSQEGSTWEAPRNVDIDHTNVVNDTFQFNPDGTCTSGSIFLDNTKGRRYRILVLYTGRMRIQEGW